MKGCPYTKTEVKRLRELAHQGYGDAEIARALGRGITGVAQKRAQEEIKINMAARRLREKAARQDARR